MAARIFFACMSNRSPAGFNVMPRAVREKSGVPTVSSRLWIRRVSGGCEMWSRRAARLRVFSSATVTNERSCSKLMDEP
jgi:hypothetical protein